MVRDTLTVGTAQLTVHDTLTVGTAQLMVHDTLTVGTAQLTVHDTLTVGTAQSAQWPAGGTSKDFLFSKMSKLALGPTQPPIQWYHNGTKGV
jgi:hypothetical protein